MSNTVTENISPGKAQQYLNTSKGNRAMGKVYVHSYADTMKRGAWMLNGVPIIFDNEGHLLDGHHRLLAIIEAGIPVRMDVVRGVSPEAFTTYDCGRHRNVGQILSMQGVKHYNLVGSIVVANDRLIRSGRLWSNNTAASGNKIPNTNTDLYELYRRDPEGYGRVADLVCSWISKCRVLIGSWAGGLFYYLTHTGGYTEEEVIPFFDALYSLDSDSKTPADLLRRVITREAVEGRRLSAETLWAFIVKAWNGYITGDFPKILRYQEREGIPALILK